MNTAILISFTVPAIVATFLTILLIKERDYFFQNRSKYYSPDKEKPQEHKQNQNDSNDWNNHWDFSGGTLGL